MSLFRAAARTMLASYFVINGVKAVKSPDRLTADAEPVANAIVPTVKRLAPAEVAARIPSDTETLVRINGVLQAVGGLALATGIGRRFGAFALAGTLIPTTLARHPFWKRTDPQEKADDRAAFVKNVALLGGVLIAAGDTQGHPSIAWRAEAGRKKLSHDASSAADHAGQRLRKGGRKLRKQAERAAKDARKAARSGAKDARKAVRSAAHDVQSALP